MCPFSDSRQIYKNQFDKKVKEEKKIIEDARKEAESIVNSSRKSADELAENTKSELKLFAGQAVNAFTDCSLFFRACSL